VAGEETTIAIFAAAVVLGALSVGLLFLAARRMLGRQEQVITAMLARYDDRLAEFAQTLNDALNQTLPARIAAAISGAPPQQELPEHGVMRLLELARERTAADAAIAVVGNRKN
jgi:threonine dehydrogenase-like Zn-dependent dehydrogenase